MAALDFPSSPTNGQTYTSGSRSWIYNSTLGAWEGGSEAITAALLGITGSNTGDETAARIATAMNAGTIDSSAADSDQIAVTSPAGGYMTLTTLWTWIVAKLGALTSLTAGGAWSFSSSTRPTSSGTGTPAETSTLLRSDARRKINYQYSHQITYFTTAQLTAIGGTASSISTTGSADLPSWTYRPASATDGANNYQALLGPYDQMSVGSTRATCNWSQRKSLSMVIYHPAASNGTIRYYWGPRASTWAGGALAVRGVGFEIVANTLYATCHNGTSKTTSGAGVALTTPVVYAIHMESDGAGGVRWWVNGTEQTALTGGPTGNSTANEYGFVTEVVNPTPATSTFVNIMALYRSSDY